MSAESNREPSRQTIFVGRTTCASALGAATVANVRVSEASEKKTELRMGALLWT
jgi:hypothetical protein